MRLTKPSAEVGAHGSAPRPASRDRRFAPRGAAQQRVACVRWLLISKRSARVARPDRFRCRRCPRTLAPHTLPLTRTIRKGLVAPRWLMHAVAVGQQHAAADAACDRGEQWLRLDCAALVLDCWRQFELASAGAGGSIRWGRGHKNDCARISTAFSSSAAELLCATLLAPDIARCLAGATLTLRTEIYCSWGGCELIVYQARSGSLPPSSRLRLTMRHVLEHALIHFR